jgi:hypothetical protein
MAQRLVDEALELTKKGRNDAAQEGFNTETYLLQANAAIQKTLEHIKMLQEGIAEDVATLERKMKDRRVTDDYDLDTDSGKPVGRQFDVNGREIR